MNTQWTISYTTDGDTHQASQTWNASMDDSFDALHATLDMMDDATLDAFAKCVKDIQDRRDEKFSERVDQHILAHKEMEVVDKQQGERKRKLVGTKHGR